jgi:hypothetical protein
VLVSIGVWILRVKDPNIQRPFRAPVGIVPIDLLYILINLGIWFLLERWFKAPSVVVLIFPLITLIPWILKMKIPNMGRVKMSIDLVYILASIGAWLLLEDHPFGLPSLFVLVSPLICLVTWILRVTIPNMNQWIKVQVVPILGALICLTMIVSLDKHTLTAAFGWMAIGLVVYFAYSRKRSKLFAPKDVLPTADDFEKK